MVFGLTDGPGFGSGNGPHEPAVDPDGDDLIQPFLIDTPGLRGRLVRLGPAVDRILTRHAYPDAVAQILGEALALAAALAGALKYDGVFTLQTKGDGPVGMVVADVGSNGTMRGVAQFDPARLTGREADPEFSPAHALLGSGYLAFTVDQGTDTERYQGIVELTGAGLADCARHYFEQSEQLQTGLKVACRRAGSATGAAGWRAGALMVQRVPREGGIPPAVAAEDDEDWRRSLILMDSATAAELTDPGLAAKPLLFRLFHEDGVRVFPAHGLIDRCRCSRERVETMLQAFPEDEVATMTLADGEVEVVCEFCNRRYRFDPAPARPALSLSP